ncbi:hypothetical protein KFK09_014686 [Dendrobium nobile]|uniref:Uncharacterized protein n=1 Tax=Dendrobium nobile TaxID=94219 RepID=A0A8T3B439_DENNO|nr:hypothetical protein KFK09_014686 [Dendrobium nobile]
MWCILIGLQATFCVRSPHRIISLTYGIEKVQICMSVRSESLNSQGIQYQNKWQASTYES